MTTILSFMGSRPINRFVGIVKKVSRNRSKIWIELPRGGTFLCRNEGFEVGEQVCFLLDPLKRHVLKVIPKDVADARWEMGQNEELQIYKVERPEDLVIPDEDDADLFEQTDEYLEEVANYGEDENYPGGSEEPPPKGSFDFGCQEDRGDVGDPADFFVAEIED
jgi:hypothetical protein